jgi:hypothetical protein
MVKATGICKLTDKQCGFVKCHILPRSLTHSSNPKKSRLPEAQFIEIGSSYPKLAHSSWYDCNIVGQEGEDILSKIDDAGFRVLHKHKLLGATTAAAKDVTFTFDDNEVLALRRLFLSILWRAAVSRMSAFEEVVIADDFVEVLRLYICDQSDVGKTDFPISFQRVFGPQNVFNISPICDDHVVTKNSTHEKLPIPRFSFYCDGLYVFIGTGPDQSILYKTLGKRALGQGPELLVECVQSQWVEGLILQRKNMALQQYPYNINRLAQ